MQKYAFAVEVPTLLEIYCEGFGAPLSAFSNPFSRFSLQYFFNCLGLKTKAIKKRISTVNAEHSSNTKKIKVK